MQRPFTRLALVAAVVATAGLASCRGDAPTEASSILSFASRDTAGGDSVPGDTIPGDSIPGDTIPPDTIPPDTIPPDTIPPDTIPPDTIPPDTIPPDTIPPDTIPPDTIPPDTIPPDTVPPDTIPSDSTVQAFRLRVFVVAGDSAGDTTTLVRVPLARVVAYRYSTFPDSSAAPNATFRQRTGSEGIAVFPRLRPAWYRIVVEPPRGAPYGPGTALVAPATTELVNVQVLLPPRAP